MKWTEAQIRILRLRLKLRQRYVLYGAQSRSDGAYRYGIWILANCERYGARF